MNIQTTTTCNINEPGINERPTLMKESFMIKAEKGYYKCPADGCEAQKIRGKFSTLSKHCLEVHNIVITKITNHKESTKKKYALLKKREQLQLDKISKSEQDIFSMSTMEWQSCILLSSEKYLKQTVDVYGVAVVPKFCHENHCNILNSCLRIAQKSPGDYPTTTISGGTQMLNIPLAKFVKTNIDFSHAVNTITHFNDKIRAAFGNDFSVVGDISFLTTPFGAQKQFIHSDNILKNRYNGFIVLSETAKPTVFLRKPYPDIIIEESPYLDKKGRVACEIERNKIASKYSFMMQPLPEIERKMHPVSSSDLKQGDLVIFEADMVHRGDNCLENKTLCFFHVRRYNQKAEEDLQFHAGLLGSLLYGRNPKDKAAKDAYFKMIKMHDQSIPHITVHLYDLLGDEVKKAYMNWLKTQPFDI